MKILSIGNSFSQDATRYLHRLALSTEINIKVVNLYIGGCSLKTHYYNILEDSKSYDFEFNGERTGIKVSIKDALMSDEWDFITLQQVSHQSPKYFTYQPYLNEIALYIRKYCPHSKIVMHQTWAYEEGSERLCTELGYEKASDMFADIEKSYENASKDISAFGIIPSGQVFMQALKNGIEKIHRDTFHASYGIGRYALALTWYTFFTGGNPNDVKFNDFDAPVVEEEIERVKRTVKEVCF